MNEVKGSSGVGGPSNEFGPSSLGEKPPERSGATQGHDYSKIGKGEVYTIGKEGLGIIKKGEGSRASLRQINNFVTNELKKEESQYSKDELYGVLNTIKERINSSFVFFSELFIKFENKTCAT